MTTMVVSIQSVVKQFDLHIFKPFGILENMLFPSRVRSTFGLCFFIDGMNESAFKNSYERGNNWKGSIEDNNKDKMKIKLVLPITNNNY